MKIDAFAGLSGLGPFPIPAFPPLNVAFVPIVPAVSAVSAGVGGTFCVNVPLYSVASNDHWTADFDTEDFDDLIANIAMPARYLLPGLANVYGKVAADVTPAIEFLGAGVNLIIRDPNVTEAKARKDAVESFAKLMATPVIKTLIDQGMAGIDLSYLKWLDPNCAICWVIPHG